MRRNLLCIYNFLIKIYITYTTHAHRECVCVYWRGQWIYSIWVLWSEVCSVVCALLKWWNGRHTERVFVNYGANLKYFPTIVFQVSRIHSNFDGPVKTMTVTQYFIIFYGFAFFLRFFFSSTLDSIHSSSTSHLVSMECVTSAASILMALSLSLSLTIRKAGKQAHLPLFCMSQLTIEYRN